MKQNVQNKHCYNRKTMSTLNLKLLTENHQIAVHHQVGAEGAHNGHLEIENIQINLVIAKIMKKMRSHRKWIWLPWLRQSFLQRTSESRSWIEFFFIHSKKKIVQSIPRKYLVSPLAISFL